MPDKLPHAYCSLLHPTQRAHTPHTPTNYFVSLGWHIGPT